MNLESLQALHIESVYCLFPRTKKQTHECINVTDCSLEPHDFLIIFSDCACVMSPDIRIRSIQWSDYVMELKTTNKEFGNEVGAEFQLFQSAPYYPEFIYVLVQEYLCKNGQMHE